MRQGFALSLREFKAFFRSITGYILLSLFLAILSFLVLFLGQFILREGSTSSEIFFQTAQVLLTFFLPALSMNSFSSEYKRGSIDILKSFPLSSWSLIFSKALGAYLIFLIFLVTLIPFWLIVAPWANFDMGIIFMQFVGLFLLGIAQLSLGIFVSSLFKSPILSYILTILIFLLMYIGQGISYILGSESYLGAVLSFFSLEKHFLSFNNGIFSSYDFFYFILMSLFFLKLAEFFWENQKER